MPTIKVASDCALNDAQTVARAKARADRLRKAWRNAIQRMRRQHPDVGWVNYPLTFRDSIIASKLDELLADRMVVVNFIHESIPNGQWSAILPAPVVRAGLDTTRNGGERRVSLHAGSTIRIGLRGRDIVIHPAATDFADADMARGAVYIDGMNIWQTIVERVGYWPDFRASWGRDKPSPFAITAKDIAAIRRETYGKRKAKADGKRSRRRSIVARKREGRSGDAQSAPLPRGLTREPTAREIVTLALSLAEADGPAGEQGARLLRLAVESGAEAARDAARDDPIGLRESQDYYGSARRQLRGPSPGERPDDDWV